MLADTELTDALRLTFAEATSTIDPPAGLGSDVRRRHRAARRRRAALCVTVPAAVAAAVGSWVAVGPGSGTSSPVARGTEALPNGLSTPSQTPAAYELRLPADVDVPCLPALRPGRLPTGGLPPQLVLTDPRQGCVVGMVSFIGGFPPNSWPIDRPGLAGLHEMAFPNAAVKQIFEPIPPVKLTPTNPSGSCYDLTISADVSDQLLATYFLPALANVTPGH